MTVKMNACTFQRRARPMDFPSPASAVHSKSGEEGSPDQQLCRIPLWPQATSSQLGPVRRDSDQGGHRTFPSVRNQAEPDGHKTFRSWDPFGACRRGGPWRPGPRHCWLYRCSLTRVGGCYAHPWPRGGAHSAL